MEALVPVHSKFITTNLNFKNNYLKILIICKYLVKTNHSVETIQEKLIKDSKQLASEFIGASTE
jgi:hypothetical protein